MSRNNKRKNYNAQIMNTKSLVDIVIPTAGRFDMLGKCLEAIPDAAKDIPYTIIVVDNASPKEKADEFYQSMKIPNMKVIRNKENYGYPRGCNQGVARGYSPIIFIINDDVILEGNSIPLAVKAIEDPNIGVVGIKLMFPESNVAPDGTRLIQHIGIMTIITGDVVHAFLGWRETNAKVNSMRDVLAVTGAALMTKRNIWRKIGGFDEIYGIGYYEDVDYCLSVRELGYNVIVEPKARGTHYVGSSFKMLNNSPLVINRLKFAQKWANKIIWTEWMHW